MGSIFLKMTAWFLYRHRPKPGTFFFKTSNVAYNLEIYLRLCVIVFKQHMEECVLLICLDLFQAHLF